MPTKRKSIGEWISSHILPIISVVGIIGGALLTFYLTVHDNTQDLAALKLVVETNKEITTSKIDDVDDDIDEAVSELSETVFQTLQVFDNALIATDEALFVVEEEVENSSDTLIGVSRDISTLQRDYEQLDDKIDQQLINQQDILNAIFNISN
ncbi:hypothetical protein KAU11_12640 [Candidatus Babeliales bacterium]|nr:hypothetical protein [Candidatus Babeliales bacterium]